MAGPAGSIDIDGLAGGLPRRIHEVTADYVTDAAGQIALIEDGAAKFQQRTHLT